MPWRRKSVTRLDYWGSSRLAVVAGVGVLLATPAWAAGSITFKEVMELARQNPKLVKEIEETVHAQGVKRTEISCEAGRFGNQWRHLGGGRSLPINCTIGNAVSEWTATLSCWTPEGK